MHTPVLPFPSIRWFIVPGVMVLLFAGARAGGQTAAIPPLQVTYTGALYGYFRDDVPPSPARDRIAALIQRDNAISDTGLLLGMGDNFAPEFGATIQRETVEQYEGCILPRTIHYRHTTDEETPPGYIYKTGVRIATYPFCDNVVDFMLRAGYRAAVPGREDFVYGAQWVRKVGMDLKDQDLGRFSAQNHDHRFNILVANARIKMKGAKGAAVACPLLLSDHSDDSQTESCNIQSSAVGDGEPQPALLSWLERLDTLIDDANLRKQLSNLTGCKDVENCAAPGPWDNATANVRKQLLNEETDALLAMVQARPAAKATGPLACQLRRLEGDEEKGRGCAEKGTQETGNALKTLDAELLAELGTGTDAESQDLLTYGRAIETAYWNESNRSGAVLLTQDALRAARRANLRTIWGTQQDIGFTVATVQGQGGQSEPSRILVIGVVGQDTMKAVSPDNKWLCMTGPAQHEQGGEEDATAKEATNEGAKFMDCVDPQMPNWDHMADVVFTNPVPTVVALLRAAPLELKADRIVLMAQMTSSEAEEMGARVWSALNLRREAERKTSQIGGESPAGQSPLRGPDLILSEADTAHASQDFTLQMTDAMNPAPVLTPYPAYRTAFLDLATGERRPEAKVSLAEAPAPGQGTIIQNLRDDHVLAGMEAPSTTPAEAKDRDTTMHLLLKEIEDTKSANKPEITAQECDPTSLNPAYVQSRCEEAIMHYILGLMIAQSRTAQADVAMLERNDFNFDFVPAAFSGYEVCDSLGLDPETAHKCRMQTAFDRVLWNGDDFEEVMVAGSDLSALIAKSQQENDAEEELNAPDTAKLWLVTLGIVAQPQTSVRKQYLSADQFSILEDEGCRGESAPIYCVHKQPIQADASYWVATVDHLADDTEVYPMLSALPQNYATPGDRIISKLMVDVVSSSSMRVLADPLKSEQAQQTRPLNHLDIAKWIAGFNWRDTNGGDAQFAQFQGVADARANTPYSQEIDLETQIRAFRSWNRNSVGALTDLGYDRLVQGNLIGNFVNPSFPLNSFDAGMFDQFRINPRFLPGPSWLWLRNFAEGDAYLVSTLQYQRQLSGTYLIVPFTVSSQGQLTQPLPAVVGFSGRLGIREVAGNAKGWSLLDKGSYVETGVQFTPQWNVLREATFLNGTSSKATEEVVCNASGALTIANCIKKSPWTPVNGGPANATGAVMTVNAASTEAIATANPLEWGAYWDLHLARQVNVGVAGQTEGIKLQLDTRGDYFSPSSPPLSTQTLFDLPITISAGLPFLRNLSVAPSYTLFLFKAQNDRDLLIVNGMTLKFLWYFDRDSGVPFWRQFLFKGPASESQTAGARIK